MTTSLPGPTVPCPCGEVHELSAKVRAAYEAVTAGLPPAVAVAVEGAGCWLVPFLKELLNWLLKL